MADIRAHSQTLLVKESIMAAVKPDERGRVRLSEPLLRQTEGRIVVENFDSLCVTRLIATLPRRSRVFSRAPHRGGREVVLSRLDVYYPLDDCVWRMRKLIMFVMWIVFPLVGAFVFLFT
jgi:hypothetical protein